MRLVIFFSLLMGASSQETPSTAPSDMPSDMPSLFPTATPSLAPTAEGLEPVCGDCWCIADPDCPEDTDPGINDEFPLAVSDLYATFVLTNPTDIQLKSEDGSSDCFPFQDSLDLENPYDQAKFPQCKKPASDGYCAFVFEDENEVFEDPEACKGRRYALKTFATPEEIPSNAALTHKNACGVCSSAQDLGTRMKTRNTLEKAGVRCGTRYFVTAGDSTVRWEALVSCWEEEGFTRDCAVIWAHFTATNAALCAGTCLGHEAPFNGAPPECEVTDCLKCGDPFSADFDLLAGRDQPRSGITENIGRDCSLFYSVVHDPCPGQSFDGDAPTGAPSGCVSMELNLAVTTLVAMLMVGAQA